MKKIQVFFLNAIIMTCTALLMNAVGVWFNLYISNKIGAEGMGIFQLIMSVYSLAITFATSGIYLAATRLVAEETAAGGGGVKSAMRRCLLYSVLFGCMSGFLLHTFAPTIGIRFLGSAATVRPLEIMGLSMPFVAMSTALAGYFTAVSRVVKSSIASAIEQFVRITLTIVILTYFAPPGLEYACLAITGAGVVAEVLSFLCALTLYLRDSRALRGKAPRVGGITARLLGIALPVAVSSYLRTGLTTVKNLLVPVRLQAGGLTSGSSYAVFGTVHGVALPVVLFPAAFLNSFSSLIVPEIAQRHSTGRPVEHLIRRMFAMNLLCSLAVCGVLFSFPREIAAVVTQNPDVAVYIRLLAPVIPIMYLDTAVDCMLKGMDEQVSVMRYNVIDAGLSMISVYLLLPVLGIKGYILVICLSEVFNFSLSLARLAKVAPFAFDLTERLLKPFLCISISTVAVKFLLRAGAFSEMSPFLNAAFPVMITGLLYLFLLRVSGYSAKES